jgi:protocatechuate 3,4-dioxygenase beta subunit
VATQVVDGEPARVLLELQPCATLEGGVVGGSGAPLAEAEVTFHLHESHEFERSVRTDARGQYRFDCLLPGSFEVTARAKGFRPRALQDGERLLVAGETRRMDFRLAEEVPFDGIVVDTEGQALAGARVVMYWGADEYPPSEESLIETVQAITGEDGRFSAHGLAPGTYGVQIMLSEEFEVVHERAQVPGTGVRFVLVREPPAPGVIVGTVVGERGQPLAGVTVEAQMQPVGQREFMARTNEVGQFRLEKLPLATWSVTATHDGTALTGQVQAMVQAEVRGPEPVLVQLQLGDGLSVSGRVVDGRGAPVPSVYVTATRSFPSSQEQLLGGSAETDEQGRFALHHLAPGDHDLEVRAQEPNSLLAPARGSVRAGSTDVRLVMGAMPQVQGRVVHADGSPVPSFIVNDTAFTGTEGRFLLPLPPPGPFAFVFRAEGLASTLRRLDAPHPSDAVLPDVTLVRGQAVRGRVLDADTGKPIEEAWVAPLDFAFHGVLSVDADQDAVWTQADGRFLLPAVEPGRVLCVEFEGYQPARLPLPRDGEEAVIRLRPLTPTKASDTPP